MVCSGMGVSGGIDGGGVRLSGIQWGTRDCPIPSLLQSCRGSFVYLSHQPACLSGARRMVVLPGCALSPSQDEIRKNLHLWGSEVIRPRTWCCLVTLTRTLPLGGWGVLLTAHHGHRRFPIGLAAPGAG